MIRACLLLKVAASLSSKIHILFFLLTSNEWENFFVLHPHPLLVLLLFLILVILKYHFCGGISLGFYFVFLWWHITWNVFPYVCYMCIFFFHRFSIFISVYYCERVSLWYSHTCR
jgi:hypothetical protein